MTDDLAQQRPRFFAFGPFALIPERQLLLEGAASVRIGGRALDILTVLVERAGELVTKAELMERVWPDTFVDETNLRVNVAALRRTLGDGGANDVRYIATVPGFGYRFVAPVTNAYRSDLASTTGVAAARRDNLPIGTTRILGRADVIDTILADFETSRIVTIVGPGGIGKTTVALAVVERAIGAFEDGVWLVDFSLFKDPNLAPNAIATAIGLAADRPDMLAAVCESLRDRKLLLLLDSCEHITAAAASCVDRILSAAARVTILVTSREPLLVNGERVHPLPGLGTPPSSSSITAETALTFPAVQLFVDRATDKLESFELDDADAWTVAEICRRLDGLALAIELAATRIDAFGVGGILDQLDDRFRLLVGRRAAPQRHRTLTATLDWSYSLLSPEIAAVLRAVSSFAGVFDIDGASAVSGVAPAVAARVVAELSAKSLLAVDLDGDNVAYRLLETTRAYCLSKLDASSEGGVVRQRHAEQACTVIERATVEWAEHRARGLEAASRSILDDLRAALAWVGGHPPHRLLLIRLTLAGSLLWNRFSHNDECRVHATKAIEELDAAGLAGSATEMQLQEALAGAIICTRGLLPQATNAARRALDIAVKLGSNDYRLRCLRIIGVNELLGGQLDAGMRTLEAFTELAAVEDQSAVPAGEVHLAIGEFFAGRLDGAQRRVEGLRQRYAKEVDSAYFARFLWDIEVVGGMVLSNVEWLTGFPDSGARTVLAAVEHARKTGHELSVSNALAWACPIFFWSGLYAECRRYVAMLDEKAARHGIIAWRPVARFYRGALACATEGAKSSGLDDIGDALAELRAMNHMVRFPYYSGVLAHELGKRGRLDEAEQTILGALAAADAQSERWCVPELLRIHASISRAGGLTERAERLLLKSLAAAEEISALSWRLRTANDLARLWGETSKAEHARTMLLAIRGEFTQGFETQDLAVAADLLARL